MKSINEYMDELKAKTGSDYATAKALDIRKSAVSMIRSRGTIADETAIKIAEILEKRPGRNTYSCRNCKKHGAVKAAWLSHAKKIGIAASLAFLTVSNGPESNANTLRPDLPDLKSVYYVKYGNGNVPTADAGQNRAFTEPRAW
ncbi:hypothetical protein [Methylomonas koyamae]|uniref:hypothetical protein n=1 Tax=Methylomonas koyamae TaxID=702114 RepID=UPI000A9C145F|nr:hypothetical protein [Methylomonas koyamae]